ncbi:MAG: anti-sigma factor family protein [Gammaproteobacteria bacterium]
MTETCPRIVELSAWIDEQLAADERRAIEAHVAACPVCAATHADLRALRTDLRSLPVEPLGVDLAGVIEGRLAQRPAVTRTPRRTRPGWAWLPLGAGMLAAASLGVTLGAMLTAGGGATLAPRMAAMAVFDPIAPGGLCIGLDTCHGHGARP